MDALYRFIDVEEECSHRAHSFTLHAGDVRVLQLDTRDEKSAIIDCAIGDKASAKGSIEIVQGDRRQMQRAAPDIGERRVMDSPIPLLWQPVLESQLGKVGWVDGNGGLISNLRIWENITLPLWYHKGRDVNETERRVVYWSGMLGLDEAACEKFMDAQPYQLESWQRKLAGLLRALVQSPAVIVVDASLFTNIRDTYVQRFIDALESYAAEGFAVLAIADKITVLKWEKVE